MNLHFLTREEIGEMLAANIRDGGNGIACFEEHGYSESLDPDFAYLKREEDDNGKTTGIFFIKRDVLDNILKEMIDLAEQIKAFEFPEQ